MPDSEQPVLPSGFLFEQLGDFSPRHGQRQFLQFPGRTPPGRTRGFELAGLILHDREIELDPEAGHGMFHPSPLIDQNRIDAELEMESLPKIELR